MNKTPERRAWLFVNRLPRLGPMRFWQLQERGLRPEELVRYRAQDFLAAGIGPDLADVWSRALRNDDLRREVDAECEASDAGRFKIVLCGDSDYPARLSNVDDRPPVIYVQGRWPLTDAFRLGVVGTRHPTEYGRRAAAHFAEQLTLAGVSLVSGLAAGIDACAHEACLANQGETVAVLGHGLAHQYPKSNARLYEAIRAEGTLLTEFPYNCPPDAWRFPQRNRVISGLSAGVLVVQAGAQSGSLVTARCAAEQGRPVFVVPGDIFEGESAGCNKLLADGATPVSKADDILAAFGVTPVRTSAPPGTRSDMKRFEGLEGIGTTNN